MQSVGSPLSLVLLLALSVRTLGGSVLGGNVRGGNVEEGSAVIYVGECPSANDTRCSQQCPCSINAALLVASRYDYAEVLAGEDRRKCIQPLSYAHLVRSIWV